MRELDRIIKNAKIQTIEEIADAIGHECFKPGPDLWDKMKQDVDTETESPSAVAKKAKSALLALFERGARF